MDAAVVWGWDDGAQHLASGRREGGAVSCGDGGLPAQLHNIMVSALLT